MHKIIRFLTKYFRSLLVLGLIFFLSTISADKVEEVTLFKFQGTDKIVHLIMYLCLSLVVGFELILNNETITNLKITLFVVALAFTYGAAMELIQKYFTLTRSGDLFDLMFDTMGILLAVPFIYFYQKFKNRDSLSV